MVTLQKHRTFTTRISGGKAAFVLFCVALVAVLLSVGVWKLIQFFQERETREARYYDQIEQAGSRHGVEPDLIRAVIWKESSFDNSKIGKAGEIGLMQIMQNAAATDWAREKQGGKVPTKAQLSEPKMNIDIGSWYLGRALRYWKSRGYTEYRELALCEYNAGRSRAEEWKPAEKDGTVLDRIKISSTKTYVGDVMRRYEMYRAERLERENVSGVNNN